MILRTANSTRTARRGAILIVVLALLTIFALVALTFVFYSGAEADGSRIYKQGQNTGDNGLPDAKETVNAFMSALIFDAGDNTPSDLLNALRGHSLARSMYGWNSTNPSVNMTPFVGLGTFHEQVNIGGSNYDRPRVVNMTVTSGNVVDPEWGAIPTSPPTTVPARTNLAGPPTGYYHPKNAPYTYADANNLYLGMVSPQTGEVVAISYYRDWIFRDQSQAAGQEGLHPSNPNWTNPQGRFLTLRPRPQDNIYDSGDGRGLVSDFPYPGQDADGKYRGDVMNAPGGYNFDGTNFNAKNDSIWIDIGLPMRKWNNKWVKPLVAALVLDKNGCVSLSANGNNRGAGGTHVSHSGFGPWEVNPSYVLGGDAMSLIAQRQNNAAPVSRTGVNTRGFAYNAMPPIPQTGMTLSSGGLINWDAVGGSVVQLPGGGFYSPDPRFGAGYDNNTTLGKQQNHPSLFVPAEWPAQTGNPRTFANSDLRRFNARFAAEADYYQQTDLAKLTTPPNASLLSATGRNDAAHRNRLAVAMNHATLDLSGMMVTAPSGMNPPTPGATTQPYQLAAVPNRFPTTQPGLYYLNSNNTPPLAPLNLNRALTDYRTTTAAPLSTATVNAVQAALASTDRQTFARDIFARLVLATGNGFSPVTNPAPPNNIVGYTNGTTVTVYTSAFGLFQAGDVQILVGRPAVGAANPQYDGLRYLAQLAANIVDYIDNDDVSTTFVWNPSTPGPASAVLIDPQNYNTANGNLGNNVVYGVEKPRIVINEVYSEITNDRFDPPGKGVGMPPKKSAEVRFWIELLNPTNNAGSGPIGNGQVDLTGTTLSAANAYRLQIARNGQQAVTNLTNRANVLGDIDFGTVVNPEIEYDLKSAAMVPTPLVGPNNGAYDPVGVPGNGIVLFGPQLGPNTPPNGFEFNPKDPFPMGTTTRAAWNQMVEGAYAQNMNKRQNTLTYQADDGTGMGKTSPTRLSLRDNTYKHNIVVLQRLANPYLIENDPSKPTYNPALPVNQYITVDYMAEVPSWDAVERAMGEDPGKKDYSDPTIRFAMGKVQPYAGYAAQVGVDTETGNISTSVFPVSMVLQQQTTYGGMGQAWEPMNTMGRHNGLTATGPAGGTGLPKTPTETIMAPFDMMLHLDRPLVNQMELLHVLATSPSNVTQDFVREFPANSSNVFYPNNSASGRTSLAYAPWIGSYVPVGTALPVPGFDPNNIRTNNSLYRAFDLLRVKPWGYGVPMGGKVHGKVNINTIQDYRVLQALFDPQGGNSFNANMNAYWTNWIASRTPNMQNLTLPDGSPMPFNTPIPGMTVDDALPSDPNIWTYDRPFKPFGVPEMTMFAGGMSRASGMQDTILRPPYNGGKFGTTPLIFDNAQAHPYLQAEAVRKILNNTTTISNTYVVFLTVSYFECRTDSAGNVALRDEAPNAPYTGQYTRPILGREAYREVPGDIRQKFCAVVDRNNLMLNPTNGNALGVGAATVTPPFFIATEAPSFAGAGTITVSGVNNAGSTFADGTSIQLLNSNVVIGIGATAEVRQVTNVGFNAVTGYTTLTLNAPLSFAHDSGECVSNGRFGNPGPQANVDVMDPNSPYRLNGLVPYVGVVK